MFTLCFVCGLIQIRFEFSAFKVPLREVFKGSFCLGAKTKKTPLKCANRINVLTQAEIFHG
jgi:hypothetical protein